MKKNDNKLFNDNNPKNTINNPFSGYDNNINNQTREQKPTPKHNTSQKHKTPNNKYNINPLDIPRPNQENEIYLNKDKIPLYETNIGAFIPYSNSFFSVKETQNSSCRFIFPTYNTIPDSQSFLDETGLPFTICVQPFYQIPAYDSEIPKVEVGDSIFRCEKCKSYINNKYNITYSNKPIAICNICHYENDLNMNTRGVKNEYLNSDNTSCPELINPTIDFIAPEKFRNKKIFIPHYLFMIDISESSYQLGLPSYIINSIQITLDSIHNSENSYIAFALYDIKNIYYFYIEKDDIRISIMGDMKDPFCPLSLKKLYIKIGENKEKINILIEKLNYFIEQKNKNIISNNNKQISTITGAAIKSGVDSLIENGGRVMIFTCNPCFHGFGCTIHRESYIKLNEKDSHKTNPFFPQHNEFVSIGEKAVKYRIVIDQFIFRTELYDISTFSLASNISGGEINFYNCNKDSGTVNSMFEKLHYDITRILTRPNYYNCKFMLRYSKGLDCYEILGPFNKKLGEAFELGGCDPDYCYCYNLRLNKTFKNTENAHIQLAVLFDDNYSNTYIRIFNYSFNISNQISQIYGFINIDSIMKSLIYKSITLIYNADNQSIINYLEDKVINSYKYYRVKEKKESSLDQLIIPLSIQYLPLYINSYFKLNIFSDNMKPELINHIISITNKLMREPVSSTIKYLYPKLYRIDDIEKGQYDLNNDEIKIYDIGFINEKYNIIQKPLLLRLSKDVIDFDCAYLIDDGIFIYIYIFNEIDTNFYSDLFNVDSFKEAKNLGINSLDQENLCELNKRILNIISQLREENNKYIQTIRLFFLDENSINEPILNDLLKEDKIGQVCNYPEYLCTLHQKIQERMKEY